MTYSENLTTILEKKKREKDQGVTLMPYLTWKDHILEIRARENRILVSLKKAFVSRDSNLWKDLYISLVWLHLDEQEEINSKRSRVANTPKCRVLTRSNVIKIRRDTLKSKIRNDLAKQVSTWHNYFFNRITPTWNASPENIVKDLNIFQKGIDDRFKSDGRYS